MLDQNFPILTDANCAHALVHLIDDMLSGDLILSYAAVNSEFPWLRTVVFSMHIAWI